MDSPAVDTPKESPMRAATIPTYGTPETLTLVERAAPTAGPTELLVRVHASPVTQGDRRIRAGDFPGFMALVGRLAMGWSGPRADVGGAVFAGVVEAVGAEVTGFQPGDRVFGTSMDSAHAELLVVDPAKPVAHLPDGVSFAEAAAVPFGAGTALPYLRDLGKVKPGDRVLIVGAAGGVGRYAVQIARHLGAHVTGVARADQAAWVRSLGADAVIERETTNWRETDATWDVIFDTSDRFGFEDARPRLTANGRFLTLGLSTLSGVWDLLRTRVSSGPRMGWTVVMGDPADMQEIARMLVSGALRPLVEARFSLEQIADAHRTLEARTVRGDIVVDVVPPTPQLAAASA
jgi:NADPH:quinone reductase-like Zn-dependent oxidoreductase